MKQLIYISKATLSIDFVVITDILMFAIPKNHDKDITGILVYDGVYFIQVLEGDENVLLSLFEKIKTDARHHDIKLFGMKEIEERDFKVWNMGYINNFTMIKEILLEVKKSELFNPFDFTYDEILEMLKKLSHRL